MQNKFSTFLAISGLVVLTSFAVAKATKDDECKKKLKRDSDSVTIQAIKTNDAMATAEWNGACNHCSG